MARVIPTGGSDQTAFFVARNAAADDALARLYMSLLARREERERMYEQQKALLGMRHGYDMEKTQYLYGGGQDNGAPNPMGNGPQLGDNPLIKPPTTAAPAPTAAAPATPPVNWLPSRYPQAPSPDGVTPPAPAAAHIGPNPDAFTKTSSSAGEDALRRTFAQAQPQDGEQPNIVKGTSGATEFSSQSRNPTIPGTRQNNNSEPGTVKAQYPTRRPRRVGVEYAPIHPQWISAMDGAEKKYGLPQGSLMTLYGYENGGGNDLGKARGTSANGLFQFTNATRQQWGVSDRDKMNPAVMIEAAAKNLRYNANVYKKMSGKELPSDPRYMPYWIALHQFGSGNGPRIVHASLSDSGHMSATDVMLKDKSNPNANYATLVNNNIPGTARVDDLLKGIMQKAIPWYDRQIQLRSQGTTPQVTQAGDQPPRPSASVPHPNDHPSISGASPRLVRAVRGGADIALPEGYTIRATSGLRHGRNQSYHNHGKATDWQIIKPDGTAIPNQGEDTTGLYTKLARGVKTWVAENDPSYMKIVGYGGAFDANPRNPRGSADLMHYDEGGSRGNLRPQVRFANLQPLDQQERRAPASAAASTSQPPTQTQAPQQAAAPPKVVKPINVSGMSGKGINTFGAPTSAPIAVASGFGDSVPNPKLREPVAPSQQPFTAPPPLPTPRPDTLGEALPPSAVRLPNARPDMANALPPGDVRMPQGRPDLLGSAIPDAEVRLPQGRPIGADYPPVREGWTGAPTAAAQPPAKPPHVSTPPDMWRTSPVKPLTEDAFIEGGTPAISGLDNPFGANTPNTMVAPDDPEHIDIKQPSPPTVVEPEATPEQEINIRPEMSQNLDEFQSASQATPEQQAVVASQYQLPKFSNDPNPQVFPNVDAQSGFAAIRGNAIEANKPPPATIPAAIPSGTWQTLDQIKAMPNQPQLPPSNVIPTTKQVADAIFKAPDGPGLATQLGTTDWNSVIQSIPKPDYSGGGNTWAPPVPDVAGIWNSAKNWVTSDLSKANTQISDSDARGQAFNKAMKEWVQKKVMDAAEGGNRMINDWRYGPSKVTTQKTDGSGAVIKPTTPATSSTKPNAATAPQRPTIADPGGPKFQMPPLPLIPNKGGAAAAPPPFQANSAPPLSNPSGAKTIPSGAPAMPAAGGSKRPGIPFVAGPDGSKKYLTPEEQKLPEFADVMNEWNAVEPAEP